MEASYHIQGQDQAVRFIQITDPHLFSHEQYDLLGINTAQSFQAVLNAVSATDFAYDFVLATGDLVQDHHREAYHRFGQMTKALHKPLFWLEGNHDTQPQMDNALALYQHLYPEKHLLAGEHWQLILLDSHLEDQPKGWLAPSQLDFLTRMLTQYPDRYTLIVLHHNILPTGSLWLDQHSLANAEQLADTLFPFKQVKALLHGHIHQAVDSLWKGYRVFATPSTCIQFKPNCADFTLDLLPQGWREMTLLPNGQIHTEIKRLTPPYFLPNTDASGY